MKTNSNKKGSLPHFTKWVLLPCLGLSLLAGACNSDDDTDKDNSQTGYVEPSDVAVTAFSLKADTKILTGLDSVYFAIDLERGLIFNADSLPKGTKVTDIIPVIKYSNYISSAKIVMEGGEKRTGEVDYKSNPNDSIDFTGNVKLTLTSTTGNSRSYLLKVNVHKSEPDSLCWGNTAWSKLPARTAAPKEQRTVQYKDKVLSIIQESDGSFTLSANANPGLHEWQQTALTLPFTPRLRTLSASSDKLWMLAADGKLYNSADGLNWSDTGNEWYNIIGAYNNVLMGIKADSNGAYSIVSEGNVYPQVSLPAGFPIEDFTNMYSYQSKWMAAPVTVLSGGVTSRGEVSSAVWAFDGNSWAKLSSGLIPSLRGAVLVPYYTYRRNGSKWTYTEYNTMLMLGGLNEKGELNRKTYITYDNGVNWIEAASLLTLPDYIPGMWQIDQTVNTEPMEAPLLAGKWRQMTPRRIPSWYRIDSSVENGVINWECPYIYLYGGCNASGELYNTIWCGVINRLRFKPII